MPARGPKPPPARRRRPPRRRPPRPPCRRSAQQRGAQAARAVSARRWPRVGRCAWKAPSPLRYSEARRGEARARASDAIQAARAAHNGTPGGTLRSVGSLGCVSEVERHAGAPRHTLPPRERPRRGSAPRGRPTHTHTHHQRRVPPRGARRARQPSPRLLSRQAHKAASRHTCVRVVPLRTGALCVSARTPDRTGAPLYVSFPKSPFSLGNAPWGS